MGLVEDYFDSLDDGMGAETNLVSTLQYHIMLSVADQYHIN